MDRPWLRYAKTLTYRDPGPFLVRLRELEILVAESDLPERLKALRTNELKSMRELREAAIFCYGMGQRIGRTVYLAPGESQDYDFIASWVVGEEQHFAPVQLKEVVPVAINPNASLPSVVSGLVKYVDSKHLTVVVHLNRQAHFDPSQFVVPPLSIAALWIFGAVAPDQSAWGLWGNFTETAVGTRFEYPAA
jgi:hypothetical protein